DNMVGTVVGTYVIFHSSLGMFYGNIFKTGISGSFRSKKQQFEVHHIIDNDRKIPVFITDKGLNTIPRLDTADLGIVSASQGLGGLHDNVFVLLRLCKSVVISITAIYHEYKIMGSFVVFLTFQKCQCMLCLTEQLLIFRILIQVQKRTGIKSTGPISRTTRYQTSVFVIFRKAIRIS